MTILEVRWSYRKPSEFHWYSEPIWRCWSIWFLWFFKTEFTKYDKNFGFRFCGVEVLFEYI